MEILKVKQLSKLKLTVYKGSDEVKSCYRKVVLTGKGSEEYDITLRGDDALIPLEVGQLVMVDLRCESYCLEGEWNHDYYVMSITPLEMNAKIEFEEVDDWTSCLV